jgi:hypothetical protein
MAAPTPTARQDPAGIMLEDGYRTLVTFARDPDIEFWEKGVTPPGLDGGDPIDTTTMHNDYWRSATPRSLVTMTEFECRVAYDPVLYTRIQNLLNIEDTVTVRFPDGSTLAFYGFLRSFEPDELVEGEHPEATIMVVPTNADPVTGDEEAPVLSSVAGT